MCVCVCFVLVVCVFCVGSVCFVLVVCVLCVGSVVFCVVGCVCFVFRVFVWFVRCVLLSGVRCVPLFVLFVPCVPDRKSVV